jgi:hypothetical protein
MILWAEEHTWEITESGEFVNSIVTSDIIAGIGADRVWSRTRTILWSMETLLNAADDDGGLCTAPKCTPPPHLHSLTQLLSELDFWIQEVEVLTNSTSCISTTCRHPLDHHVFTYHILFPSLPIPATQPLQVTRSLDGGPGSLKFTWGCKVKIVEGA